MSLCVNTLITGVLDKHIGPDHDLASLLRRVREKMESRKCCQHDAELLVCRELAGERRRKRERNPEYLRRIAAQERWERKMYGTCESDNPQQRQIVNGDADTEYGLA